MAACNPGQDPPLQLLHVPPSHVDKAWRDGAHRLAKACDTSGGEVTGDQLKMLLARGERTLLALQDRGRTVGWGVIRVDQLPNLRALHVCELYAPGAHFERFFTALRDIAEAQGCSEIRCSAKPAQARLYSMKAGFEPIYTTLRVRLHDA